MRASIVCLIYRSTELADWVYDSAIESTPMLGTGEAEFFFVANDPTPEIVEHLTERDYPFIVNVNPHLTDDECFAAGYGKPEYVARVYRGYNAGILHARGEYVVLVNSDHYFAPEWLEGLLAYADSEHVVTSLLVERTHPVHGVFPGAVPGRFGGSPEEFEKAAFLDFAARLRTDWTYPGVAYMPVCVLRDLAIEAGLYPEGNIAGQSFDEVVRYGDEAFMDRLAALGCEHVTSLASVVYHLKEGERDATC
jgi:glycosyltransferase involved in cell wall biosynthesis